MVGGRLRSSQRGGNHAGGLATGSVMDYRELAEQCDRLAQRADEGEYRTLLMKVAAKCHALADQMVAVERAASHNRQTRRWPKRVLGSNGKSMPDPINTRLIWSKGGPETVSDS